MTRNTSFADRVVRFIVGAGLILTWFLGWFGITGTWAIILGVVGIVLVLTAFVGFCPFYALFGINTNPERQKT